LTAQRLGNDLCRIETGGFHVLKFLKRELICKGNISYMNTFAIVKIEAGCFAGRILRQQCKSLIIILLINLRIPKIPNLPGHLRVCQQSKQGF